MILILLVKLCFISLSSKFQKTQGTFGSYLWHIINYIKHDPIQSLFWNLSIAAPAVSGKRFLTDIFTHFLTYFWGNNFESVFDTFFDKNFWKIFGQPFWKIFCQKCNHFYQITRKNLMGTSEWDHKKRCVWAVHSKHVTSFHKL